MNKYIESRRRGITCTQEIKRGTENWIGHNLRRNCHLKHVIEGKIGGTERRGRRRKQLLDDLMKSEKS